MYHVPCTHTHNHYHSPRSHPPLLAQPNNPGPQCLRKVAASKHRSEVDIALSR
jgi:hypothetical protein